MKKKQNKGYVIESGIPVPTWSNFNIDSEEYRTMTSMKVGQSFKFSEVAYKVIQNTRYHLQKNHPKEFLFTVRKEYDPKTKELVKGMQRVFRMDPRKARKKRTLPS